jgi:cobalt-precorrin 5A hydrolase
VSKKDFWIGIGCQRGTSTQLIAKAIQQVFEENQLNQSAIAGIATIDTKASEPGLREFCHLRNLAIKTFPAEILRLVCVPNPSAIIDQTMGTPSVAEAAAILAAANHSPKLKTSLSNLAPCGNALEVRCVVPKQTFRLHDEPGAVTVAVAQKVN